MYYCLIIYLLFINDLLIIYDLYVFCYMFFTLILYDAFILYYMTVWLTGPAGGALWYMGHGPRVRAVAGPSEIHLNPQPPAPRTRTQGLTTQPWQDWPTSGLILNTHCKTQHAHALKRGGGYYTRLKYIIQQIIYYLT